jgi:hypothetical protein
MLRGRLIAPLEKEIDAMRWGFAEAAYEMRCSGATWRQIAELAGIHRAMARRYVRRFDIEGRRYGFVPGHAPSCNAMILGCAVFGEAFTTSRADARYCSSACRQDAYRKRKVGTTVA